MRAFRVGSGIVSVMDAVLHTERNPALALGALIGRERMTLEELQQRIDTMYSDKDRARGAAGTFLWLSEEIGELAAAIASGTQAEKEAEFADVLTWLVTLANVENVDLAAAVQRKYGDGCPGCGKHTCICDEKP